MHETDQNHEKILLDYMEESRHFQEITQLYEILLFDMDEIFDHYDLRFDDRVMAKRGAKTNILHINALVGNAVSAARTLIESMETFDRIYVRREGYFKKNYISKAYDEYFSYRFVDFLRNDIQHGHVPISFDGEKIFFQLSEILDVKHMKMNASLKKSLKAIERELVDYGEKDTRLAVIPLLYEYFLLVYTFVYEFLRIIKFFFLKQSREVGLFLKQHPEYVTEINGEQFAAVYQDDFGSVHGFYTKGDVEGDLEKWISFSKEKLEQYKSSNGHLFFLEIHYGLENRMPVLRMIDDNVLTENLETFCLKNGSDIHRLSFESYYGRMAMNAAKRIYPYIQYEDGVRWNVPYQEVTIEDFVRTFPEVQKCGLKVSANNSAGAEDFFQRMMQDWSAYLYGIKIILEKLEIQSPADVIDWASRIVFVWQGIRWLGQSFASKKQQKPFVRDLIKYIRKKDEWDLVELERNLHARSELLELILIGQGYVLRAGTRYKYDTETAEKIEHERKLQCKKRDDSHGTSVNCYGMNEAVERLNTDLLYLAVLEKERGILEEYDKETEKLLAPLKPCQLYLLWDDLAKCVRIAEKLPEIFREEDELFVWQCVTEADRQVNDRIRKLETGTI